MENKNENETKIVEGRNRSAVGQIALLFVTLSLVIALLAAGVVVLFNERNDYRNRLLLSTEYYYYELANSVGQIELSLSKMLASSTTEYNSLLASAAYRHSEVAQVMLTQLPNMQEDNLQTEKFLNQVGDWALAYSAVTLQGRNASTYNEQIEGLYVAAKRLSASILAQSESLHEGGFEKLIDEKDYEHSLEPISRQEAEPDEELTDGAIYPQLVYDGAYSDSEYDREYKGFAEYDTLSEEEVRAIVQEYVGDDADSIKLVGTATSQSKSYEYELDTDDGLIYISVSPFGGKVLNFSLVKQLGEATIGQEEAYQLAETYAQKYGYDVQPVWYNSSGAVGYVKLAPITDGITHYTDVVKIKLALDDGTLLGLEAKNYCMHHCTRELTRGITLEEAMANLNENLNVTSSSLAVVPYGGGSSELLCYEFAAEFKGLDYLIYISAVDGHEINILRVVEDGTGKSTL